MNNEELLAEIKELRKDMKSGFQEQKVDHLDLRKEFYIFKGKAMGFMGTTSVIFAFFVDYLKKKLGM